MIDPVVRPARPEHVDELDRLQREARTFVAEQRGGDRWLETHPPVERWDDLIGDGHVAVATIDEVPVGYIVVGLSGDIATVDDVYVTEPARELGFGDELLAWAVAWGRARSARRLEGIALPGDRETKNLYERAGIKARLIIVSASLDDPS